MFSFLPKKLDIDRTYTPRPFRRNFKLILSFLAVFLVIGSGAAYAYYQSTQQVEAAVLPAVITKKPSPTPTLSPSPSLSPSPKPSVTPSPKKEEPKPTQAVTPAPQPVAPSSSKLRVNFPNNKVGIHIYANTGDVDLAAQLINTSGGDWGWVTLNYDINDRGADNWNAIFQKMKDNHVIPIVQLFNHSKIPTREQTEGAADFLNSLNWPTQYRYISAYNEVNADEYWDWKLDPGGYAEVLNFTVDIFKARNRNFFLMNGAFNASARSDRVKTDLGVLTAYMSEDVYLKKMNERVPGIFKKLDGWASHCYPHPYYSGKPLDWRMPNEAAWEAGRDTMSSYKWELGLLQQYFGITDLQVFITEAGWPHKEGGPPKGPWLDESTVARYYKEMYEQLYFKDARVVAVTPFILKINPLANFSWIRDDGTKYPQWDSVVSIPKVKGAPPL